MQIHIFIITWILLRYYLNKGKKFEKTMYKISSIV